MKPPTLNEINNYATPCTLKKSLLPGSVFHARRPSNVDKLHRNTDCISPTQAYCTGLTLFNDLRNFLLMLYLTALNPSLYILLRCSLLILILINCIYLPGILKKLYNVEQIKNAL